MWLVAIWMVTSIIAKLQHKETVTIYGSRFHNRVKPIMVAMVTIPYVMQDLHIEINHRSVVMMMVVAVCVISYSVINNKMLETVPMYIMQTTIVVIYIETTIIDILIGVVPLHTIAIISILFKIIGVYYLTKQEKKGVKDKKVYLVILLLSILAITRMYVIAALMEVGYISKGFIVILTQMSIFFYANIRYRKEKIEVTREVVLKYIPQVILTMINDIIYITMITKGVSKTVDIDILSIILLMLIETKLEVTKNKRIGILIIGLGWLVLTVG